MTVALIDLGFFADFFIELDQVCGPLTLHSTLKELVNYTRHGLASIGESDCGRGGGAGEGWEGGPASDESEDRGNLKPDLSHISNHLQDPATTL